MKCRFSVRLDVVALAEKSASLDNPSRTVALKSFSLSGRIDVECAEVEAGKSGRADSQLSRRRQS
jgi:hypothetical protein